MNDVSTATDHVILDRRDVQSRVTAAAAFLPKHHGQRMVEVAHSHEQLRAELYRARRCGQTRIVLGGDDLDGYEFGADLELADRFAFVIGERVYLVGTLDVLAATAQTVLAEVAAARAR